jgi:DUF438 domain-containing protein
MGDSTKEALKGIIRDIHQGKDPDELKSRFKTVLDKTDVTDIGKAEQELVEEGLPRSEIRRLCDIHLSVMADALPKEAISVPPGHPIHTLQEEHNRILEFLDSLEKTVSVIKENPTKEIIQDRLSFLRQVAEHLMEVEGHNRREENVLFPYLEKRGISEPPAVMWSEHNDLREMKKELQNAIEDYDKLEPEEYSRRLSEISAKVVSTLSGHIFKENNVLYPMAIQVVKAEEWDDIREQCDELGYCCFTPETASKKAKQETQASEKPKDPSTLDESGTVALPTGTLTLKQIEWIFNTLPIEVTFVDKDDIFRYFSGTKDRAFARARASIGRKVQQCHPSKSLDMVNGILSDFKAGRKDTETFWIHLGDKYLLISYFAVRDADGEYLGTLETIQDIAPIQKISGDKRLR